MGRLVDTVYDRHPVAMDSQAMQQRYMLEQLTKGIRRMMQLQAGRADECIYSIPEDPWRQRSGLLGGFLHSQRFDVSYSGAGVAAVIDYPVYIRFLDMRRNGNMKIYNRIIWGALYRETLKNIKYEYRDWLRKVVSAYASQKS